MSLYINGTYVNGSGSNPYSQWDAFTIKSFLGESY